MHLLQRLQCKCRSVNCQPIKTVAMACVLKTLDVTFKYTLKACQNGPLSCLYFRRFSQHFVFDRLFNLTYITHLEILMDLVDSVTDKEL